MNDAVETAFKQYVQTAVAALPQFTPAPPLTLNWYTSGEAGTIVKPWIGFEMLEAAPLHADTPNSEGQLKVTVQSQSDDETEAVHDSRVSAITAVLSSSDWRTVSQAITGAGAIRIFGYNLMSRSRNLEDKNRTSALLYNVGFGPI